jgi:hypothetical protein
MQWQNIYIQSLYLSSGRILTKLYDYNLDHLGIWLDHFLFYVSFVQWLFVSNNMQTPQVLQTIVAMLIWCTFDQCFREEEEQIIHIIMSIQTKD